MVRRSEVGLLQLLPWMSYKATKTPEDGQQHLSIISLIRRSPIRLQSSVVILTNPLYSIGCPRPVVDVYSLMMNSETSLSVCLVTEYIFSSRAWRDS